MEWISLCLVAVVLILLGIWMRRPKHFLPGPPSYPIIGSLPAIAKIKASTRHDLLWTLSRKYGPVMRLHLGLQPVISVTGYEAVKQVLNSEDFAARPNIIPVASKSLGKRMGIFFTDGPKWREQRRFILRNLRDFGFGKRSMEALLHEEVCALLNTVDTAIADPNNDFNLLPILPAVAINVLWTIMAGRRHDLNDIDFQKLTTSVLNFFREGNTLSPVGSSEFLQKIPFINASYLRQLTYMKDVRNYIEKTIDEHLSTYDEHHMRDFMDTYIKEMKNQSDSSFTRDQLCAVCIDLFNAGTETTASTVAYGLRYLVQYPRVQDELRQELHRVLGTERLPTMDDFSKLHYSQAVIAETLRHAGLAPFTIPHTAACDTQLLGYPIPKDSFILINLWSVHMDPDIWGDPKNFRPDRFIADDGSFRKDEHAMFFGQGPRMCLGEPLARFSALFFLTALVQRFSFEPRGSPPSNEQLPGFTTSPAPYSMLIKHAC